MPSSQGEKSLYSIQSVYNLSAYKNALAGYVSLRCRNKIEIPVAERVTRMYGANVYTVIPAIALVLENRSNTLLSSLNFILETNEGVTVEPLVIPDPFTENTDLYLLTLPRGTTGVKNVHVTLSDGSPLSNDLLFDIMKAPYNYENYLFNCIFYDFRTVYTTVDKRMLGLQSRVSQLESRVAVLENKQSGST